MFAQSRRKVAGFLSTVRGITRSLPHHPRAGDFNLNSLEQRRLFSFDILGTEGPDNFIISVQSDNKIHLTFNGGIEVLNPPSDGRANVLGFGGDDMIWIQNTGTLQFDLSGFAGNDTFRIGNGVIERDIKKTVRVFELQPSSGPPAHGGTDSIIIDDSISSGGTTYEMNEDFLKIASSPSQPVISWMKQPEDSVLVKGSLEDDILIVRNLPQNSIFDLGDGDDQVAFGAIDGMVPTDLPDNATIEDGGGFDKIAFDDSNPSSPRTRFDFDDSGLLNSVNFSGFHKMEIRSHVLADGTAEPVTFRGRTCPSSSVTLVGTEGPDLVQFGTFQNPIDIAELYVDDVTLKLKNGDNKFEVDESDDAVGHTWTLVDNKLEAGIMTINNPTPVVGPFGPVEVLIKGTRNADRFLVGRSSLNWNVTFDGRGGSDTLEQAPLLIPGGIERYDLDDAFVGYVKFDGGSGDDSIILSDGDDQTGDGDQYRITRDGILKDDFDGGSLDSIITYSFIDRLYFTCDEDANTVRYDLAGFAEVDISGGGGDDLFVNKNVSTNLAVMINSLPKVMRLHGGSGFNKMFLDDSNGGAGDYDLGPGGFVYSRDTTNLRVQFSGMSFIDITGSNQANTAILRSKPQGTTLNFVVNDGDDTFIVGGGDIDASGLHGTTLAGGGGQDKIVFDDSIDDHASFDADVLTINFQTVTKDGVTIAYGSFESQKVITSGVMNGPVAFANTVRVHGIAMPTEICDTPGDRWTEVEVGNGPFGLSQVQAPLTLTSTDSMDLTVFDPLSTVNKQFQVGATTITQNNSPILLNITHSGLGGVNILGGNTDDQFIIDSVAPGTVVFCDGGGGNDLLSVGNGTFANIKGPVHFAGGAGAADKISFSNLFDFEQDPITATLTSFSFTAGGGPLHQFFNGVEQVQIALFSAGGTTINLNSTTAAVTIIGGSGDDQVNIKNLRSSVTFNGGGEVSGDSILIDDTAITTNDNYIFDGATMLKSGGDLTVNGVEHVTLQAGSGHNDVVVNSTSLDLHLFTNAGNDTIRVNDSTGFVTVNTGAEQANPFSPMGDWIAVNMDSGSPGDTPASVRIDQDDTVMLLQVGLGGTLRVENDAVLCNSFSPTQAPPPWLKGVLDLAGGALLYRDNGLSIPFRQWLTAGRNGGAWSGTSPTGAINSSLAAASTELDGVGHGTGAQLGLTTIGSYTINPGDTLVRYAPSGDADLNGAVDIADFARLAARFNTNSQGWSDGDYNYDNVIDIGDFASLAANFNTTVQIAQRAPAGSDVLVTGLRTPFADRPIDLVGT